MSKNPYIVRMNAMVEHAPISQMYRTLEDAKSSVKAIGQLKKELALIKKELVAAKHQVRANAVNQRNYVGKGFGGCIARGLFGAKTAGSINASTKNHLRNQELKVLQPYEEAERHLSHVLVELDRRKLELETWITRQSR